MALLTSRILNLLLLRLRLISLLLLLRLRLLALLTLLLDVALDVFGRFRFHFPHFITFGFDGHGNRVVASIGGIFLYVAVAQHQISDHGNCCQRKQH